MATAKTLCLTVFTAAGCSDPLCPYFHPRDPAEVYRQIAAFAVQAEKSGVYVDPLTTVWVVCTDSGCSEKDHVHATPLVKGSTARPLYDVLLVRRHRRSRGEFIRSAKKGAKEKAVHIANAWKSGEGDKIRKRLSTGSAPLAGDALDAAVKKELNLLGPESKRRREEVIKSQMAAAIEEYDREHPLPPDSLRLVAVRNIPTPKTGWYDFWTRSQGWSNPWVWGVALGSAAIATVVVVRLARGK